MILAACVANDNIFPYFLMQVDQLEYVLTSKTRGAEDLKKPLLELLIGFYLITVLMLFPSNAALAALPQITDASFQDITGHWAEEDIIKSNDMGIMQGTAAGIFAPEAYLSRVQLAALLYRVFDLGSLSVEGEDNPLSLGDCYTDLEDGQWYNEAVLTAVKYELLDSSKSSFRPDDPVNRFELAEAMSKCLLIRGLEPELADVAVPADLDNDSISSDKKSAAVLMVQSGIMQGYENGEFNGNSLLTRAEAAVIFNRCFSNCLDSQILIGSSQCSKKICGWAEENKKNQGLFKKNFDSRDAYFYSWGQKPTGGYAVEISQSKYDGEKWIIDLRLIKPEPDKLVITVLTYPYEVFAVPANQTVIVNLYDKEGQLIEESVQIKDL